MARLTIEDQWWTDPRRTSLIGSAGGAADSIAIQAWRTAQEYWKRGRVPIPKEIFDLLTGAVDLIRVGLAVVQDNGVYIRGSAAYLDWLNEKQEASSAGGKTSAKRPRDKKGRLLSKQSPSEVQVTPSESSVLTLTLPLSPIHKKEGRGEKTSSAVALPTLGTLWNEHRGTLSELRGCAGTRRKHAEARWREQPDTEYWTRVVQRIARSPFCTGDNDRGWRADFDFLIRPETRHKVEEGKYDPRGPSGLNPRGGPPMSSEARAEMAELEKMRKDCNEGLL